MKKRIVVSVIEILLACLVIVAMLFGTFYVSRKIDQRFFTGKSYIYLYPEEDNTPISVSLSDDTVYASEDPYPTFSHESTWNVRETMMVLLSVMENIITNWDEKWRDLIGNGISVRDTVFQRKKHIRLYINH